MIFGCARGSGLSMRTWPREVGRRLHTLAVNAGKGCSGSPNLSSESGCTWNSMFGVACSGDERANAPICDGAIVSGPVRNSADSSAILALPAHEFASVFEGKHVLHLERHAQL